MDPPVHGSSRAAVDRTALLQRAMDGDVEALGLLLASYRQELVRRAERALHRRPIGASRPSDLVQDALERALKYFSAFRGSELIQFSAWLRQLQVSVIKDAFRKAGAQKRQLAEGSLESESAALPRPSPRSVSEAAEQWRKAFLHMDELAPRQRDVLRLVLTHGLTPAEAAQHLNLSEQEIYTALRHGGAQLHRRLFPASVDSNLSLPSQQEELLDRGFAAYMRRRPLRSQSDIENLLKEYAPCATALRQLIEALQQLAPILADAG